MKKATPEALEARLLDLLYGELSPDEAAELHAELAAHPELAARFEGWQQVQQAMAALPEPEPDPQIHYDLLREARKAVAEPERRGFWDTLWAWSMNPMVAGLGLLVLAGGMLTLFNAQDAATPGAEDRFAEAAPSAGKRAAASAARPAVKAETPAPRPPQAPTSMAPEPMQDAPPPVEADKDAIDDAPLGYATSGIDAAEGKGRSGGASKDAAKLKAETLSRKRRPRRTARKRPPAKKKVAKRKRARAPVAPAPAPAPEPKVADKRDYAPPPPAKTAEPDDLLDVLATNDGFAAGQQPPAEPRTKAAADTPADREAEEVMVEPVAAKPAAAAAPAPAKPKLKQRAAARPANDDERESLRGGAPAPSEADATLARARAARQSGDLRAAARAYDAFGRFGGHRDYARAMFEAADTYEKLGDTPRAVQLYALVVRLGGPNAARAQARINTLTPPPRNNAAAAEATSAPPPPVKKK